MGKNARQTVWAGQFAGLVNRGFATVIESDVPIIAERSMYFGALPFWKGGHESAGVPGPAQEWSLAEGATGSYFDTYLLVANPNDSATAVTFRFLLGGEFEGRTYTKTVQLAPNSRYTLNPESLVDTDGFTDLADVAVSTFVSATQPIVVERAMYWPGGANTWTEAHNSFGVTQTGTRWGLSEGRVGGSRRFQTYVLLANATDTDAVVKLTFMRESGSAIVQTVGVRANSRYNVYVNGQVPGLLDGERFGVLVESQVVAARRPESRSRSNGRCTGTRPPKAGRAVRTPRRSGCREHRAGHPRVSGPTPPHLDPPRADFHGWSSLQDDARSSRWRVVSLK